MKTMSEEKGTPEGYRHVRLQIANQCAPVLTGIKPSNIVILGEGDAREEIEEILVSTDICCDLFYEGEGRQIWLFYRQTLLKEVLKKKENREFLTHYGYRAYELEDVMRTVRGRFLTYKEERGAFPHEIGLILGYPLADVRGFIENRGQNFLCSGYWKVYENEAETRKLFDLYTEVKHQVVEEVLRGTRFWQIAEEPQFTRLARV